MYSNLAAFLLYRDVRRIGCGVLPGTMAKQRGLTAKHSIARSCHWDRRVEKKKGGGAGRADFAVLLLSVRSKLAGFSASFSYLSFRSAIQGVSSKSQVPAQM